MIIFKKAADITHYLSAQKAKGKSTGFVPTMGALHKGHLSLIEKAGDETALVVCSIFVNPTQFNNPKDFEKYPVTLEQDIYLLEKAGCGVLFLPSVEEIYPAGLKSNVQFDLGYLEEIMEGKFRPGHFQGVCQVMYRLLQIVQPNKLYLGQKDLQQCMVIKKMGMVNYPSVEIIINPTQREPDGLAMSSRNLRLDKNERQQAPEIFKAMQIVKKDILPGEVANLKHAASQKLTEAGFKVDYVEIADANTLRIITNWDGKENIVVLVAAFLNEVRLIDNLLLN